MSMSLPSKHKVLLAGTALACVLLSGCETTNPYTGQTQSSDATIGTAMGGISGAAVGALAGGGRGALIGGAVGALGGGLIGHHMDNENAELRQILVGTGVQVVSYGNTIQLVMASDVTFAFNQPSILSSFYLTLNSVANVLKKYNKTTVIITGYTDNVGSGEYNQRLSEERAKSVGDYLISQNISANRIITEGRGKLDPIASNQTAQGRAMNRRVTITLKPID